MAVKKQPFSFSNLHRLRAYVTRIDWIKGNLRDDKGIGSIRDTAKQRRLESKSESFENRCEVEQSPSTEPSGYLLSSR